MFSFSSALTQATLIKRYKRFLADVRLENGEVITVHCPNTGAMTGCDIPNTTVYLSRSTNKKRKYEYTWEYATDLKQNKICVNTNNANKVVLDALEKHKIAELVTYGQITKEQKLGESRIDFLLQEDGYSDYYLEVKSATLAEHTRAMFPDTVTKRGQKHCYELAQISKHGIKSGLLFCIMRENISEFSIAEHIDPDYASAVKYAAKQGVEILCYGCDLRSDGITISHSIPIIL